MKTYRTQRTITSLALIGLSFGALSVTQAQTPGGWGAHAPTSVRLATPDSDSFGLSKLAGKPLHTPDRQQLGTVSDFLIEANTGRVHFALVPSGSGAAGETFRLVPMAAVQPGGADGLNVRISPEEWNRVGTMTQAELPARVTLNADQLQRLGQQFTSAGQAVQLHANGELVRASSLKGQALRSGNDQVGTVDDVVIDLRQQVAAAVVKSANGYAGNEQRFLVPMAQIKGGADANAALTTSLGRQEFAQAQAGATGFGRGSFGQGYAGGHPVQAAQSAVRQAAGGGVQVIAETKLLLRGTVDSEQKRSEAERAAVQAAPGMRVENQIDVRR